MKLFEHPVKAQWSQACEFGVMVPLWYHEVLPSQSLNVDLRCRYVTDSLIRAALNRVFFDTFVFYIPFRLLWPDWPNFIMEKEGAPTSVPLTTNLWPFNYEGVSVAGDGVTQNTIWQRHAYNRVWNKVFRSGEQAERTDLDNTPARVLNRGRSFNNQLVGNVLNPIPEITVPIDATAQTMNIEDLKRAQAQYRSERYEYWFDGVDTQDYLNFLDRQGVKAGWEIDQSPRLIAKKNTRARFETVVSTSGGTGSSVGDPSGFYNGVCDINVSRRFFPENGIVCAYAVPRMEFPFQELQAIPLGEKTSRSHYFTDGEKPNPPIQWSSRHVGIGAHVANQNAPAWQDYRSAPSQMYAAQGAVSSSNNYVIVGDVVDGNDSIRDFQGAVQEGSFFRGFIGNENMAIYTEINGAQRSPVPPVQVNV